MFKNCFFTLVVIMSLVVVITLTVREALAFSAIVFDPEASEAERQERSQMADRHVDRNGRILRAVEWISEHGTQPRR